jgi:hypothetical protein
VLIVAAAGDVRVRRLVLRADGATRRAAAAVGRVIARAGLYRPPEEGSGQAALPNPAAGAAATAGARAERAAAGPRASLDLALRTDQLLPEQGVLCQERGTAAEECRSVDGCSKHAGKLRAARCHASQSGSIKGRLRPSRARNSTASTGPCADGSDNSETCAAPFTT